MKILVTSAMSAMGRTVAGALKKHDVKLTDLTGGCTGGIVANNLNHDAETDRLVDGVEAIIHTGYEGQEGDASSLLDYYSRRTYNLLLAASNARVDRCIYISTLKLLQDYEENLTVTERWRSHPPSNDPALLACHIGELVCKEFARDRLIKVATLRLGWPIVTGQRSKATATGETAALATDDLATVLNAALGAKIEQWQDVHVQSPAPGQRYLLHAAQKLFSFPVPPPTPPGQPVARKGARR
ncbi:MAG: NAD(P)-dependent oxidoreductase [Dehalococcoidia bacterium]|nr:NAD(P)-dependent oxidoreductase [Dehalococcoidia bacterium]MSQ35313.1 NAD(P)-dependent oxidoreductase [Dehalococcoidia bacterium]